MMPDPWATYKRPSADEGQTMTNAPPEITRRAPTNKGTFAITKGFREARSRSATRNVETRSMVDEALDFYVKATGRDGTQKVRRAREHEPRRTATKSGALGSTRKRSATPPRQEGASVGPLQQSAELQTQEKGGLRERLRAQGSVQRQGRREESARVDRRNAVQGPESRARTRSSGEKLHGIRGLQLPTTPSMGETLATKSLLVIAVPFFASAMTARRLLSQFSQ